MINQNERRFASVLSRFYILSIMSLFAFFLGKVIVENAELSKILPNTTMRSLAILAGYNIMIASTNYISAIRARNFTNWKIELSISIGFGMTIVALLGPSFFPVKVVTPVSNWYFWEKEKITYSPNFSFYFLFLISISLLIYGVLKSYTHHKNNHK
jgi:hypothetical protein